MDELYHHGVKGMKWGVRRTPKQLGHESSKRQVKKAIKQARKNNGGRFQKNIGYNTSSVQKQHKAALSSNSDIKKASIKVNKTYKQMDEAYNRMLVADDYSRRLSADSSSSPLMERRAKREAEKANIAYNKTSKAHYNAKELLKSHETKIAKQYMPKYEEAAIKDLGFKDIETGRQVLNKYGLMSKAVGASSMTGLRYEIY